ncbi:MAG: NAD-dependent epimerase/dehydratase family protein [Ottowia sp.]|nr:NAD-dependent epimerase/dehydratase family protein [Ottowia sp.]
MTVLPSHMRRPRLLIAGCGDVGLRVARLLLPRWRVLALARSGASAARLRAAGVVPVAADLDEPVSLMRVAGLASHVLYLAPPRSGDAADVRSRALLQALARRTPPQVLVYVSTSGVYGDTGGARTDETRVPQPQTARARVRQLAERRLRKGGRGVGICVSVFRVAGIYAPDRPGGTPRKSLLAGAPVLAAGDDGYVNHIHADDLARALALALWRAAPQRVYNVCDDSELTFGQYMDEAADLYALPRPPRVLRSEAAAHMSAARLSFLAQSRRLDNRRLRAEIGLKLRHPHPRSGLQAEPLAPCP